MPVARGGTEARAPLFSPNGGTGGGARYLRQKKMKRREGKMKERRTKKEENLYLVTIVICLKD